MFRGRQYYLLCEEDKLDETIIKDGEEGYICHIIWGTHLYESRDEALNMATAMFTDDAPFIEDHKYFLILLSPCDVDLLFSEVYGVMRGRDNRDFNVPFDVVMVESVTLHAEMDVSVIREPIGPLLSKRDNSKAATHAPSAINAPGR
jgi:hypothetical protein